MNFTNVKDIKYVTEDKSFIDLLATCIEFGEIPMTLNLVDTEDLHMFATGTFDEKDKEILIPLEEYCKKQKIAPYIIPEQVVVIPTSITRLQAKLQLSKIGKFSQVEALMQENEKARIYWNDADNFYRNDAILLNMAKALGLTDTQLDDLFLQASKL
ncbi:MAG: hypothetical protein PHV52_00260 [Aliarcobacter sp.]|nr:hypothetical protein [Aliarcobacter sp.]